MQAGSTAQASALDANSLKELINLTISAPKLPQLLENWCVNSLESVCMPFAGSDVGPVMGICRQPGLNCCTDLGCRILS
jgi:hypothetical protein